MRPAGGWVQLTAGDEQRVAQFLGRESSPREGVVPRRRLRRARCLLVGRAEQDLAVEGLEAPSGCDELSCQVVEELGVSRFAPRVPKSLGVATRPRPKCQCQTRLTITRGCERIGGIGQPIRQLQPAAGPGRLDLLAAEHVGELARDFRAEVGRLPRRCNRVLCGTPSDTA